MKASKGRDRTRRATLESVSRKKKNSPPEIAPIPPVDEAEFTEVIRKMVNTAPVERKDVEKKLRYERRRNPETDPRYLPVFNFSIKATPEQVADVERQKKLLREYGRKQKKS